MPVGTVACVNRIMYLTEWVIHEISVPVEASMCQCAPQATVIRYQGKMFRYRQPSWLCHRLESAGKRC